MQSIMAAPCRHFSSRLSCLLRRRVDLNPTAVIRCRESRTLSLQSRSHKQIVRWRPLSTSCQRYSSGQPASSGSDQPAAEEPKAGVLKRIAVKTHHATLSVLERISPRARVFYECFIDGVTSFVQDFRHVYSLNKRLKNKEVRLEDLEWTDLYKKIKMKQDMAKVLPVLVIVNIPFVYYVTLPIVLYFQRIFLSDHFISAEDVASNHQENHKKRILFFPHILESLNKRLLAQPVDEMAEALHQRISSVDMKPFPASELLTCHSVFNEQAALKSLSRIHLKYLCKLHSQWVFLAPPPTLRARLATHATLMATMDRAIMKAGIDTIDEQDLRKLCYQRGLNPVGSDRQTLTHWLTEWSHISTTISDAESSLLLHASVLLVTGRPHQSGDESVKPEGWVKPQDSVKPQD